MIAPTAPYVGGDALLSIARAALRVPVIVNVSVSEVVVPLVAEATSVTEPDSRSAWVTMSVAVQVIDSPGARLSVAGQLSSVALSSLTLNGPVRVTLPLLVTR